MQNFRSVYCLPIKESKRLNKEQTNEAYNESAILLYLLAKNTNFFGSNIKYDKKSLIENKNVIFVGALLTRLQMIVFDNAHSVNYSYIYIIL